MPAHSDDLVAVDGGAVSIQAKFIVYDEAAKGTHKESFSFDVNSTTKALVEYVAKLLGYEAGSFSLETETDELVPEVAEDLGRLNFRTQGVNKLYLREKSDAKPIRTTVDSATGMNAVHNEIKSKRALDSDDESPSKTGATSSYNYDRLSDTGFVGLANQGATCYLNSLLQTLFMTPEFRNALYEWRPPSTGTSIATELQRLFVLLQTSKSRSVETTDLTKSFGWDRSEAFHQHDVQELMRVLFEALEKKWAGTDKANLVNDLYQGEMRDFVQCKECGYESSRSDKYQDIPLVLREFGSHKTVGSVEEALAKFVETELLEKDNQYNCSKCNKKVDALKGLKLVKLPYLLTLQLKRFDFDTNTFQRIKLHDRVTFPLTLNMTPFLSPGTATAAPAAAGPAEDAGAGPAEPAPAPAPAAAPAAAPVPAPHGEGESVGTDSASSSIDVNVTDTPSSSTAASIAVESTGGPDASDVTPRATSEASEDDPSCCCLPGLASKMQIDEQNPDGKGKGLAMQVTSDDGNQYELFSIMIHSGSALGGHYYAYIKSFENNKWYCFNDSSVSEITEDTLEKTFGGATSTSYYYYSAHSMSAYMLMYRRIDKARNRLWYTAETMPDHSKALLTAITEEEERRREEDERKAKLTTVTVSLLHDAGEKSVELTVPKLTTITELTEIAHKDLELDKMGVPVDRVRLRRFRYGRVPGELFDGKEGKTLTELSLIWGSTSLMMEMSRADGTFPQYDPNGIAPDLYVCDYATKKLTKLPIVIGESRTIGELKDMVLARLEVTAPRASVLIFKTPYHARDVISVKSEAQTLWEAAIYSSTKVGVCVVPEGVDEASAEDELRKALVQALNAVTIKVVHHDTPDDEGQTVPADQRMTLREFKSTVLAPIVGLPVSEFKVYKPSFYSKSPIELTQGDDSLSLCLTSSDYRILYKKGRTAGDGEVLLETYLCDFTNPDATPILEKLGEFPYTAESNNLQAKTEFLAHVKALREADPAAWKFPVLNDITHSLLRMRDINFYGDGPTCAYYGLTGGLHLNLIRRLCFEVLTKPDPDDMEVHSPLFLRRWHPDTNTWGPLEQVFISHKRYTVEEIYAQITALSGIPKEFTMLARGPSFFPFEKTVLEADTVQWHGEIFRMTEITHGQIDGVCMLYKDRRTVPVALSADERAKLSKETAAKKKASRGTYYGKERALKINVDGPAASAAAGAEGGPSVGATSVPDAPPLPPQ
eukprot:m.223684 g.223684  ORF g.223684 m.223684 type:complete len:1224 (+) comp16297_c0_seq1:475-4146(+)